MMMQSAVSMAICACSAHVGQNALGGLRLDAAGVHQQELVAVPLAVGKNAVARDAGGVLHDGQALAAAAC